MPVKSPRSGSANTKREPKSSGNVKKPGRPAKQVDNAPVAAEACSTINGADALDTPISNVDKTPDVLSFISEDDNYPRDGSFITIADGPSAGTFFYVNGKPLKVSVPFILEAEVTDIDGGNPSIRATILNRLGAFRSIEIPVVAYQSPKTLWLFLSKVGLPMTFGPGSERARLLYLYCQHNVPPVTEIRSPGDGWTVGPDNTPGYVLDGELLIKDVESVRLVTYEKNNAVKKTGDINDWRQITAMVKNDPIAILFLLAALASVLLEPLKLTPVMLIAVGPSSIGKSTILKLVAALFGTPFNLPTWEATANGLEAALALSRHKPLIVDEVGQGTAMLFASFAYRMANSKLRADSTGALAKTLHSCSNVISAGELSTFDSMNSGGLTIMGGQQARMINISVEESYGVWSECGEFKTGAEKSKAISSALSKCYGIAAVDFCKFIVQNIETLNSDFDAFTSELRRQIIDEMPEIESNQIAGRVLDTFLLFAFAGKLAVKAKVASWEKDQVLSAIRKGFFNWFSDYKGQKLETNESIFNRILFFFQSNRGSMIKPFAQFDEQHQGTVAGYEHTLRGKPVFMMYPLYFEHVLCKGLSKNKMIALLKDRGLLLTGNRGTPTKQVHAPGKEKRNISFYVIDRKILLV